MIGSGIGEVFSVAALLARAGKKVLVLEGTMLLADLLIRFSGMVIRGMWDFIMLDRVHIKGTLINETFRYISNEKLKWAPLDDIYDRAVFGDRF